MSAVCVRPAVGHGRMSVTLRRPDTQRSVASCRQFCFQFRYVGLSCDLVWTVLSVGNMSLALFLVSLLQFLCKTLHVAL